MTVCAEEDDRRALSKPVREDGFAYATSGKIALAVKMTKEEAEGPNGDFSDDGDATSIVAKSVRGVFEENWKEEKVRVSTEGLDVGLYTKYMEMEGEAKRNFQPNERRLESLTCPCCGASLYYDDDDRDLLEKWKKDEDDLYMIVKRIVASVDGAGIDGDTYFCMQDIAKVIRFSGIRNSPIEEAWVCGKHRLVLKGRDWEAIMMRWCDCRCLKVIHKMHSENK